MDQKNPLIKSYLSFGHFDVYNADPSLSPRRRWLINALIKFVLFFSAVKLFIIVISARKPLKLYLIETYIFQERKQLVLDIGLDIVHIGHLISFSYWTSLNKNPRQLKCFDFLFVSNFEELCKFYRRRYHLDQKATEKFLSRYRLFTTFLQPIIVSYACFLVGGVLRCTYLSYHAHGLTYLLDFGIILTVITSAAYILVDFFAITKYVLVFISGEFLMLRFHSINRLVYGHFMRRTQNRFIAPGNLRRFAKTDSSTALVLRALNDLAGQFKEINVVLDRSASKMILGVYVALLGLPYFLVFTSNPLEIRLFISAIVILTGSIFYSISYYNDMLQRRVSDARGSSFEIPILNWLCSRSSVQLKALENTIHHVQPFFNGMRTKMSLNNFLLVNNPQQAGISLTFLGLRYSTYSIMLVRTSY